MKAMRLSDSSPAPMLIEDEVPQPRPRRGELLVRVHAVGVTPTEPLWYPSTHNKDGTPRTGAIPGHEFSGVVAALGEHTAGVTVGDEVYGLNDWFADGAMAAYCITQPDWVAPQPRGSSHVEAASVPIGALTAWQGLFERARLQPGESVLVHGGAGAVGMFAVQLARAHGAQVVATASASNAEFVQALGAERVIDYRAARFEEHVSGMDVVFDTVGGETLERSWGVLKPGGRMVTVAAPSEHSTDARVKQAFFIVEPNRDHLIRIANLLDSKQLRAVVEKAIPLSETAAVYAAAGQARRGPGKLVVTLAPG